MKKFILLNFILWTSIVFSQEETLFGDREIDHGGYGALVTKFTQVNDEFAVIAGAYGGWLIDHQFLLGLGGFGLTNKIAPPNSNSFLDPLIPERIQFGYGGFIMEYIGHPNNLIHYNVSLLLGGGAVQYTPWDFWDNDFDLDEFPVDELFVTEAEVRIELNVTSFFRVNLGGGYRFVTGVELDGLTNSKLSGPNAVIGLKFGSF